MKQSRRLSIGNGAVAFVLAMTVLAEPAWAYLDPGTGSMIISAIVGLFATIGLAVKTYWYKLKSLFRGKAQESPEEDKAMEAEQPADR